MILTVEICVLCRTRRVYVTSYERFLMGVNPLFQPVCSTCVERMRNGRNRASAQKKLLLGA